jgi:hypothetical protein
LFSFTPKIVIFLNFFSHIKSISSICHPSLQENNTKSNKQNSRKQFLL